MVGLVRASLLGRDHLQRRLEPANRLRDQPVFGIGDDREPESSGELFQRGDDIRIGWNRPECLDKPLRRVRGDRQTPRAERVEQALAEHVGVGAIRLAA